MKNIHYILLLTATLCLSTPCQSQILVRGANGYQSTLVPDPAKYPTPQVPINPTQVPLQIPEPVIQYLAVSPDNKVTSVPITTYSGPAQAIIQVRNNLWSGPIPQSTQIREAFGGIYPYTIVRSTTHFVIVNEANDILVIGHPNPQRTIVQQTYPWNYNGWSTTTASPGQSTVNYGTPIQVVTFDNTAKISFMPPPGVPENVVTKLDIMGPQNEAVYQINPAIVYATSVTKAGQYQVYRFVTRNTPRTPSTNNFIPTPHNWTNR